MNRMFPRAAHLHPIRGAGKARRLHKVLFTQRQKAPAHDPRQPIGERISVMAK